MSGDALIHTNKYLKHWQKKQNMNKFLVNSFCMMKIGEENYFVKMSTEISQHFNKWNSKISNKTMKSHFSEEEIMYPKRPSLTIQEIDLCIISKTQKSSPSRKHKSLPSGGIYLFNRTMCEICSKLTIKTTEWRRSVVFIVKFQQVSHIVFVFLSLNIIFL